ncbi:MarR family winged helix-turn-helix transcriptional regulator [Dyella acidiphila]|uniref:MarR family transcriptional regulator n=1 Tax=Dyella acidiphila TaxID=2775866 RepID=A0ABR9G730_9GAMM|nr:MarR family transcriptional regulator [Dyella acidiphila]MBE1159862.1 MarR family transcriptional regulator [Dyella acidiphila]
MDKTRPPSPRTTATAVALRELLGQLRRRLRDEASTGDFSSSQLSVLFRLERDGPATVTALAQAEHMRSQSMGATVAALQAVGFVNGAAHPTDGRQILLSLTPACRAWIKAHRAAREDWLAHSMHSKLSAAEQKQLAEALPLLKRLVEP